MPQRPDAMAIAGSESAFTERAILPPTNHANAMPALNKTPIPPASSQAVRTRCLSRSLRGMAMVTLQFVSGERLKTMKIGMPSREMPSTDPSVHVPTRGKEY